MLSDQIQQIVEHKYQILYQMNKQKKIKSEKLNKFFVLQLA